MTGEQYSDTVGGETNVMAEPRIDRHPYNYPWRERFPDAEPVLRGEGGAVYAAEAEDAWWLIYDEGSMADLVEDEDLATLVTLRRFDDRQAWVQSVAEAAGRRASTEAQRLLVAAVPNIADLLSRRAGERGLTKVNERDHLQPWSAETLRTATASGDGAMTVGTAFRLAYPEHWPRLGNVDITLTADRAAPVFIELKSGANVDALGPCVWDVAKNALTLRMGTACATYLLAATTTLMWKRPVRGAEFFTTRSWDTASLRSDYADWWEHWERHDDPPPRLLTLRGQTRLLAAAPFEVAGDAWELRLSRVTVEPSGWFEWEPRCRRGDGASSS
jgi:hypothetical protein